MKTTKRTLTALAMVALLAPAIESCKKGEEDPSISMRTRDSRMTGTWKLVSVEETSTTTTTTTTTNDVNAEKSDETSTDVVTTTYDGTTWTSTNKHDATENSTEVNPTLGTDGKYTYPTETEKSVDDNSSTTVNTYTFEIKMFKDNTYTATRTSTAKSYSWDNTNTYTSGSNPSFITGSTDDTTYSKAVPNTTTSEGVWTWSDSKKNKIEIVTGTELSGKILRLSNKEIILEDATTNSSDNTSFATSTMLTYAKADDQYDTKTGTTTTNVKWSQNWMRTAKFEKVDNEDEKAGE